MKLRMSPNIYKCHRHFTRTRPRDLAKVQALGRRAGVDCEDTAPPAGRRPLFREQSRRVEAWSGGPEGGLQTAFGEGGWVCKAGICETLLMPLLPGLQLLAREDEVFSSLPSP